jgi:DNA polymerase-3 subunit gamma/tau
MAYVSLYRKYRPQRFADVIGQEHVVRTLQNALSSGRIANGYLFCGTRGVAKTTLARIFAKSLNCIGPDGTNKSPVAEPCNECGPCKAISAGQCVDVIEMDAASNRSVSDMARIRENVQFGPMENRFKTYIVDEAHQLSNDAKDAFLKTLEEPPANVVFILATTESHSIPITIASRCQQFDFKRGSISTISTQIERVVGFEGLTMEPDAIHAVARAAEGSYRDALSILEQILAYKRDGVTAADVANLLGAVDEMTASDVLDAASRQDSAAAFSIAAKIFSDGKDARMFFKTLENRVRDLLYISVGAKTDDDGLGSDFVALSEQAKRFSSSQLLRFLETLTTAERDSKYMTQHRLLIEMTLLKLIEQSSAAPAAAPVSPRDESPNSNVSAIAPQTIASPARSAAFNRTPSTPPSSAPVKPAEREPIAHPPRPIFKAERANPAYARPEVRPAKEQEPPRETAPVIDKQPSAQAEPSIPAVIAPEVETDPQAQATYLKTHWKEVINHTQAHSPGGMRVVSAATPLSQNGNTIVLGFQDKAFLVMLDNPRRRAFIEEIICKVLRAAPGSYKIQCIMLENKPVELVQPAPQPMQVSQIEMVEDEAGYTDEEYDNDQQPLIDDVISIFGGTVNDED